MKLRMLHLERNGHLYRGYGLKFPLIVWLPLERRWAEISEELESDKPFETERLSEEEAERCYPGSTIARLPRDLKNEKEFGYSDLVKYRPDLFDGYDGDYIRRSPSEHGGLQKIVDEFIRRKL